MKKQLIIFMATLTAISLIFYGIGSFIIMEVNPSKWSIDQRCLLASGVLIFAMAVPGFLLSMQTDKDLD